jgi:hypothetical protein
MLTRRSRSTVSAIRCAGSATAKTSDVMDLVNLLIEPKSGTAA